MKKWAIYKSTLKNNLEVLSARRYVDNTEELSKTHLAGVVKEERLPIILNRGLGYTSFKEEYEIKGGFLEIRESEDFPLTREEMFPKNSPAFYWGWIDPEGNTYATDFEDHDYAADFLCKEFGFNSRNGVKELERAGWVRISREVPYNYENRNSRAPYSRTMEITQAQYNTLCDTGLGEDWRVEGWFRECEPRW